jgi:hypothetical protein
VRHRHETADSKHHEQNEGEEDLMQDAPDRLTAKKILFEILYFSILEIRAYGAQAQARQFVDLANLIHNMPRRLERAETESEYRSILEEMWQRADPPGRAWLDRFFTENLRVDSAAWGA